ncbi:MAG: hypothetical protein JW818_20425 [Pirellulales bacterium]|nr:hypothetical protein [Pirellulales bacterium]
MIAGVVCLGAWLILRFCARRYEWPPVMSCSLVLIMGFLVFPILCTGIMPWVREANRTELRDVSASEANKILHFHQVPDDATKIFCLFDMYCGLTEASEFTIDEAGFLAWAKQNGWQPERFETAMDIKEPWCLESNNADWFTRVFHEGEPSIVVERGYYFDTYDDEQPDDNGLSILYDLNTGRCYFVRTTY